jgi:hypothetical protein
MDERDAPIRAATVRERLPITRLATAPDPEGTPVAALLRSMWYARITPIGGRLDEAPHSCVAGEFAAARWRYRGFGAMLEYT